MATSFIHREEKNNRFSRTSFWLALLVFMTGLIMMLTGMAGAGVAQAYSSPHGSFSEDTNFCLVCHAVHDAPGTKLERYTPESAICFTCHNGTGSTYNTQTQMNNDPAANAMHPIIVNLPGNQGNYNYVPHTTAGVAPPGPYDCSQCHDPHGDSGYNNLLRAEYDTNEYVDYPATPDPYAVCFSCHDASTITTDQTYFMHQEHIVSEKAPCNACHASPHGVGFTKMIRFSPLFVDKSVAADTGPLYVDSGENHGSCTLMCHGYDHVQKPY